MHPASLALVRACIVACLMAPVASAQACQLGSADGEHMLEVVKRYALAIQPGWKDLRNRLRIPAASSASEVVLVTDETTCRSANAAYQAAADEPNEARRTLSGRVYVVQVKTTYVVWDPAYVHNSTAPVGHYMVFDSRWAWKGALQP